MTNWVTTSEAAKLCHCHPRTLKRKRDIEGGFLINKGQLATFLMRKLLIPLLALLRNSLRNSLKRLKLRFKS